MKPVLKIVSYLGLALTLLAGLLVFAGSIDQASSKTMLVVGMLLWFPTAVFWIESRSLDEEES